MFGFDALDVGIFLAILASSIIYFGNLAGHSSLKNVKKEIFLKITGGTYVFAFLIFPLTVVYSVLFEWSMINRPLTETLSWVIPIVVQMIILIISYESGVSLGLFPDVYKYSKFWRNIIRNVELFSLGRVLVANILLLLISANFISNYLKTGFPPVGMLSLSLLIVLIAVSINAILVGLLLNKEK